MGKALRFSENEPQVFEVPRLEDELIDELFYQEDEIGEMRYFSFMIACGLEEDPPDGPDVEPVPWLVSQLKDQSQPQPPQEEPPVQEQEQASKSPIKASSKQISRKSPIRTHSMEDIDILEEHIEHNKSPALSPKRKLSTTKSGTLRGMRPPRSKTKPPDKSSSADTIDTIELPLADSKDRNKLLDTGSYHGVPRRSKSKDQSSSSKPPRRSKLVATKSGTLHGVNKQLDTGSYHGLPNSKPKDENSASKPPRRSKLVATKSGTFHGMKKAAKDSIGNSKPPRRSKLVTTKSGTLHGMKKKTAEEKEQIKKKLSRANSMSSEDDDSLFSDLELSDTDDSLDDVSISTVEDDIDENHVVKETKDQVKEEMSPKNKPKKEKKETKSKSEDKKNTDGKSKKKRNEKKKSSKKEKKNKDSIPVSPKRLLSYEDKPTNVKGLVSIENDNKLLLSPVLMPPDSSLKGVDHAEEAPKKMVGRVSIQRTPKVKPATARVSYRGSEVLSPLAAKALMASGFSDSDSSTDNEE